jgi:hypothetical protein
MDPFCAECKLANAAGLLCGFVYLLIGFPLVIELRRLLTRVEESVQNSVA